jgi:hypothetical protein
MKNKFLVVFFMLLTLSIGLLSTNLPLSSSYAQNSAISQSGNGDDANQETKQFQSSEQSGQIISGQSSILSGNNLECQTQDNSNVETNMDGDCESEGITDPLPNDRTGDLFVQIYAQSTSERIIAKVVVTYGIDDSTDTINVLADRGDVYEEIREYEVPFGHQYSIRVIPDDPATLTVNFYGKLCPPYADGLFCRGAMYETKQSTGIIIRDRDK